MAHAAPVDQLKVEAGRLAQLDDRRRRKGEAHGVAALHELPCRPLRDRLHPKVRPIPQVPILQLHEYDAVRLGPSGKADAGDSQDRFDRVLLLLVEIAAEPLHRGLGLLERGARGQHDLGDEDALVLIRHVGGGQVKEDHRRGRDDQDVDGEVAKLPRKGALHRTHVPVPHAEKDPV